MRSPRLDLHAIQWVEPERDLMVGCNQDETHVDLGECHFQTDHRGATVQRAAAEFLDVQTLNVFEQRLDDLVTALNALTWEEGVPTPRLKSCSEKHLGRYRVALRSE